MIDERAVLMLYAISKTEACYNLLKGKTFLLSDIVPERNPENKPIELT